MCSIVSCLQRAAASSIASGMPSSLRQISATAGALSSVRTSERFARRARSSNSRTASVSSRDGTRHVTSPGTASGSRLVVSTDKCGLAPRRMATNAAQSSIRCSQLSRTSSDPSLKARATCTAGSASGACPTRRAASAVVATAHLRRRPGQARPSGQHGVLRARSRPPGRGETYRRLRIPSGSRLAVIEQGHQLAGLAGPPDQRRQWDGNPVSRPL